MIKIKTLRNPALNRLLLVFALLLVGLLITAFLLALSGRLYFKRVLLENQAALIGLMAGKYPEAESEWISLAAEPDAEAVSEGQRIMARYGLSGDTPDLETPFMQKLFRRYLSICLLLPLGTAAAFATAALLFLRRQYGRIRAVTRYAEAIGRGDYSLDIRDNREGDLSILKNEIYKITTLLREQAVSLRQEKAFLAGSLADISHQLKTPLTSLLMLNDLLAENPGEDKRALFLERMRAQLKRIEWLVSSLLKLSRLDAGAVTMKKESVPVLALVEKVLATLALPLEIKMLRVCLEGGAGVSFCGDFEWSGEALNNIIKNCIEHTPVNGRLIISFDQNPLYTVIRVTDSGAGIAPQDLPYIFNRFYKGGDAAPDRVGIGLAMARAIVEKQGGQISVKSEPGGGSVFTLKFFR